MSTGLAFVSFLCFIFLLALLPTQWSQTRQPVFCLIIWLLVIDLSNGITTSISLDITNYPSFHWCDVGSRISFVSALSISVSCFCVAYCMARSTSSHHSVSTKYRTIFNFVICLGVPLLYICFYPLVRADRFLVIKPFGCQASIFPSATSVLIVWVIPLVIVIAFATLAALTIFMSRRSRSHAGRQFAQDYSFWKTQNSLGVLSITVVAILVIISSSTSIATVTSSALKPVSQLPPRVIASTKVQRLSVGDLTALERSSLELSWWTAPIASIILCFSLIADPETRAVYGRLLRRLSGRDMPNHRNVDHLPMVSTGSSPSPLHHLQSGWDDTFRNVPSSVASKSVTSLHIDTACATVRSPTLISDIKESDTLDSFAESTLTYVGSPTGRRALKGSTGSFTPPRIPSPPALVIAPPTPTLGPSSTVTSEYDHRCIYTPSSYPRKVSDGELSVISSLADSHSLLASSAWPSPPAALPPSIDAIAPFARYQPGDVLPPRHSPSMLMPTRPLEIPLRKSRRKFI